MRSSVLGEPGSLSNLLQDVVTLLFSQNAHNQGLPTWDDIIRREGFLLWVWVYLYVSTVDGCCWAENYPVLSVKWIDTFENHSIFLSKHVRLFLF